MHRIFRMIVLAFALAGTAPARAEPLISPTALHARLGEAHLVIVDIRSGEKDAGKKAFESGHIPGSVHADYNNAGWRAVKDNVTLYLPAPALFEALAGGLGISNDSHVVIVHAGTDDSDFGAAARVYWTFKAMGHEKVSILDGGFAGWTAAKLPLERGPSKPQPEIFEARPDPKLRATVHDVLEAKARGVLLVDARPSAFFTGRTKHKAVRAAGHIPGAMNISHSVAFTSNARIKDKAALAAAYSALPDGQAIISYCNTGHWAATNWFMLSELLGRKDVKLYDGSMLDYTADPTRPVALPTPVN